MAKIGELAVTTPKFGLNALVEWFIPPIMGQTLTVSNTSGGPTFIWITTGGDCTMTRSSDGKMIYTGSDTNGRIMCADDNPSSSETYTITASGSIVGAKVRKR